MHSRKTIGWLAWTAMAMAGAAPGCAGGAVEGTRTDDEVVAASGQGTAPANVPDLARGRELFAAYCAACHGDAGRGDGKAAYLLSPAPRDFGSTRFRLVSTLNGAPTDEDLVAVLRRGMPGSAMPPWEWMAASDLSSLAALVRELAIQGRADDLVRSAEEDEEELSREEALEIATRAMTPGDPIPIPPECAGGAADLQEGRRLFVRNCASCHGSDGTGHGVADQVNEDGTPASPRDFTAGIFKGGSGYADIVRRLTAGLPGSSMPATEFRRPEEVAWLAAYVQSLVEPGAQERVSQARLHLRARRLERLPADAADPAWSEVEATWLPLMPLWWREPRIEGCVLRAAHDGESLAVRLTWEDPARDDDLLGQDSFSDAAALQLSREENPPLFTMGEPGHPVNIWQWRAGWELDLAEVRGVTARHPFTPPDMYGHVDEPSAPLYLTARAAGNAMASPVRASPAEMLTAEGFGTLQPVRAAPGELAARGAWSDGFWELVLTRPLEACCPGELPLEPGATIHLAAAVWDGAARDRNGQKAVTVWHVLELDEQGDHER